jgi:hypothetical protein
MSHPESFNGMWLCEVKGHVLHTKINLRGWLESIAIRKIPHFAKRKTHNDLYYFNPIKSKKL